MQFYFVSFRLPFRQLCVTSKLQEVWSQSFYLFVLETRLDDCLYCMSCSVTLFVFRAKQHYIVHKIQ